MNLDNNKTYITLDRTDIRFGIEHLPEQVRIGWQETREMVFPETYFQAENVVIVGMGGSALGPHMIITACADRLKIPVTIISDYVLPNYVGINTLVILSSFSGTTEEVMFAAREAEKRGAMIAVSTTGAALAKRAKKKKWPMYLFEAGELAHQPRLGVGFSFAGILGIFERLGICDVSDEEITSIVRAMGEVIDTCAVDVPTKENPAKTVAQSMKNTQIFVIAAEHIMGVAHVFSNCINETAKQYAAYYALPEINHHLLEGLTYPKTLPTKTTAFFVQSKLYGARTQKRVTITADTMEERGLHVVDYNTNGKTKLEEVGEVLQFANFVAYYMAMQNGVDPEGIPFVNAFKAMLGKK